MTKRIYWFAIKLTSEQEGKISLLRKKGYDVAVYEDINSLCDAFVENRAPIVIMSDVGPVDEVAKAIVKFSNSPDAKGARQILSIEASYLMIKKIAIANSFRDIIPVHQSDADWFERFQFSVGNVKAQINLPRGLLQLNELCNTYISARIVGINMQQILIESPLQAPVGSTLHLTGGLAKEIGLESIPVKILERRTSGLFHRFSESLLCSWKIPQNLVVSVNLLMQSLAKLYVNQRKKIFLVIRNAEIRKKAIKVLDNERYVLLSALLKNNIEHDPKFFDPDCVIIEDSLALANSAQYLTSLHGSTRDSIPFVVVGPRAEQARSVLDHRRKIVTSDEFSFDEKRTVDNLILKLKFDEQLHSKLYAVNEGDSIAFNMLGFPARITGIHPECINISNAYKIKDYSTILIKSPLVRKGFGRNVFAKMYQSSEGKPAIENHFIYNSQYYFSDAVSADRTKLAGHLIKVYDKILEKYLDDNQESTSQYNVQAVDMVSGEPEIPANYYAVENVAIPASTDTSSSENRTKPQANIVPISRRSSSHSPSHLSKAQERLVKKAKQLEIGQIIKKAMLLAVVIGIFVGVIIALLMTAKPNPNQGKVFTDSLMKFRGEVNKQNSNNQPSSNSSDERDSSN